jgi:hypothetical protein
VCIYIYIYTLSIQSGKKMEHVAFCFLEDGLPFFPKLILHKNRDHTKCEKLAKDNITKYLL